jgi:hypothetical protein
MTETQTGTGSQGTPEQVVVSSVLKETNEIVLKWPADGFMAKYPMNNLNLNFSPVHGQGVIGYFIGSRLVNLELVSEPEKKPEPAKPTQNPVKNPPEQKPAEPAGKPWHRTAKVGKMVVNLKNGMVQLNCSYKDYKTQELKLWSVIIPEKLSEKVQQFKEGDLITIHSVGNIVTDVEKKEYTSNKYSAPVQKPVVTIGGTINLQNYENIRIEISGPYDSQEDISRYIQTLKDTALQFGKDDITQGFVRAYVKRTFGE